MKIIAIALLSVSIVLLGACASVEPVEVVEVAASVPPAPAADTSQSVYYEIPFALQAGEQAVGCGQGVDALGLSNSKVTFNDLRFYVSDLNLIDADGVATPLQLDQDGFWQYEGTALLDFEDGTHGCADSGNADMNSVVKGTAPAGDYVAVRFDLGVPFDLNHLDVTLAQSPLNVPAMWWNWQGGYKFLRLDIVVASEEGAAGMEMAMTDTESSDAESADTESADGEGTAAMDMTAGDHATEGEPDQHGDAMSNAWFIHIGSTGCTSDNGNQPPSEPCLRPNIATVQLDGFDPATNTIVADLATFLQTVDLGQSTPQPPGCMSGADDPDCFNLIPALGLDIDSGLCAEEGCVTQTFFRLE